MTIAITKFLGSNCDRDCLHVFTSVLQTDSQFVWHDDNDLPPDTKAVVIPGGFSYGDYLRCGSLAVHRPIMNAVKRFIDNGGLVLGICNGFQILCEAKILPGILLPNEQGRFACRTEDLVVSSGESPMLKHFKTEEKVQMTVAHFTGNYFADDSVMNELERNNKIAFRYAEVDEDGKAKVNGSLKSVAGVLGGPRNNVLGLMPHPERRAEERLGGTDGLRLLKGLLS